MGKSYRDKISYRDNYGSGFNGDRKKVKKELKRMEFIREDEELFTSRNDDKYEDEEYYA